LKDYLVRIITSRSEVNIRGLACVTTGLVDEARRRHGASPTASAALGRAITGGALMGGLLKSGQRVALKFEGNGPLGKIIVEADSKGNVKGYVRVPGIDLPVRDGKLDVSGAVGGSGFLTVTKDLGLREPYRGVVRLFTGEIAEDLAYYLTESEQIPSAVGLGVYVEPDNRVSAAGGFLIQSFPPYDEKTVDELTRRIERIPSVTDQIRAGKSPEDLLAALFEGIPYDILGTLDLAYLCSCSRQEVERALVALGREEILSLWRDKGETDVTCEFCRKTYHFGRGDLQRLSQQM